MKKKTYGRYTVAATATIKAAVKDTRILCNNSDLGILVSNGCYVFSMTRYEYDAIARPVLQRDPGNFVFDKKGAHESDTSNIYEIYKKMLKNIDAWKNEPIQPAPFITKKEVFDLCYYYNMKSDFVAAYNADYMNVFASGVSFYTASPIQPAMAMCDVELFAAILPVNTMNTKFEIKRAVKSFFIADPVTYESSKLIDLQNECAALESKCITAENLYEGLNAEHAALKSEYEALKAAYEELKANKPVITLEAPSAAAAEPDTEKASADHNDPETLADLASIDGVELIVNGKQTSNPVSWVYGAEKYRDLLEALGFKWSAKKSGYWKKGIAA